jgi:CspA family cold shock protein
VPRRPVFGSVHSRVHYRYVLRLRDRRERHKERITSSPSIGGDALQDQRRKKVPQGKVKWFSTEKAFGFIEQDNDNDIFVHVTGLADGVTAIDKDMLVEYEVEQGRKGPQATNVKPASAAAAPAAEVVEATETVEVTETVETVEDEDGDEVEIVDEVVVTTDEVVVAVEDENGDVTLIDEVTETRDEVITEVEEEEEA